MIRNRTLSAAVVGALALSGLAACSSSDDGSVKLELMTGMATGSSQLAALTQLTDAFEEANQGVTVTLIPGTNSFESDLKVRLAANNAPDLWNTHGWSRDRYAEFLVPLQDQEWTSRLSPVIDTAFRDDDGALYAMPLDIAVTGLFFNETVLTGAGVDPQGIDSWDAFADACQKIVATGASCIGASGKESWTSGNISDYMTSGLYSDAQLDDLVSGTFDPAVYETGLAKVHEWAAADYFNIDYTAATADDVARLLASDQLGFVFQANGVGTSAESYNPEVKLGFMPFPAEVGDPYLVTGEDYALAASNAGDHQDEALAYLDFLAQPENMKVLSDTTNNAPAFTDVSPSVGQLETSFDYWVTEQETRTVPIFDRAYLPNGMWNSITTTADAMITGQATPAEGAAQMATAFGSLFGQDS